MKNSFYTFLVMLCSLGSVFSQGAFFKPLGSTFNSVQEFLENQPIAQSSHTEKTQITAWTDLYKIHYSFREGRLFKVEMVRDYEDRKEFREGIATIRSRYDTPDALLMDICTEKDASAFVVRKGNELHEVYQVTVGKKGFQLKQTLLDLEACSQAEVVVMEQDRSYAPLLKSKP